MFVLLHFYSAVVSDNHAYSTMHATGIVSMVNTFRSLNANFPDMDKKNITFSSNNTFVAFHMHIYCSGIAHVKHAKLFLWQKWDFLVCFL